MIPEIQECDLDGLTLAFIRIGVPLPSTAWIGTAKLMDLNPEAFAAYGGVYIAVALVWLWLMDGVRPDRWDITGIALAVTGMAVIYFAPRRAAHRPARTAAVRALRGAPLWHRRAITHLTAMQQALRWLVKACSMGSRGQGCPIIDAGEVLKLLEIRSGMHPSV